MAGGDTHVARPINRLFARRAGARARRARGLKGGRAQFARITCWSGGGGNAPITVAGSVVVHPSPGKVLRFGGGRSRVGTARPRIGASAGSTVGDAPVPNSVELHDTQANIHHAVTQKIRGLSSPECVGVRVRNHLLISRLKVRDCSYGLADRPECRHVPSCGLVSTGLPTVPPRAGASAGDAPPRGSGPRCTAPRRPPGPGSLPGPPSWRRATCCS